jgi:hypothetical protein
MNQIMELLDMEADMAQTLVDALQSEDHAHGMYFQFMALLLQEEIMKAFLEMSDPMRQEYVNLINMLTLGETLYEQYV